MSKGDRIFRNIFVTLLVIGVVGFLIIYVVANTRSSQKYTQPFTLLPTPTAYDENSISNSPSISPSISSEPSISNSPSQATCYTSTEAYQHYDEYGCVDYYVGYPDTSSSGNEFLDEKTDFQDGFAAVIYSNYVSSFSEDPVSEYGYQNIEVSGYIQPYEGHPEIIVTQPSQITLQN